MLIHVVFVFFFFYICLLCVLSAKTIQTKFDASTLHSNQQLAAETQMFDDGSGRVEVCTTFIGDYFNGFNFQKKTESKVVSTNILVFYQINKLNLGKLIAFPMYYMWIF